MRTVKTEDAVGSVLCHDLTRIVAGEVKETRFRKGRVIRPEDIPVLLDMGKENLFIWEKPEGFLHEDEAAAVLDEICRGQNITGKGPSEGKIEHYSLIDGLFRVDRARLEAINALEGLVVVTRRDFSAVRQGELLAGMKAIPLVIAQETLEAARTPGAPPLLNVLPWKLKTAGIIATGSEIANGRIKDTFTPVVESKLGEFGIKVIAKEVSADGQTEAAIAKLRRSRAEIILCTGGMSVDPDDKTPGAIRRVVEEDGGRVTAYGVPVFPGAMFMLAYFADGTPILGLPGCVMFGGRTVFDILLPRFAAGVPVSRADLASLAHGGLCLAGKGCSGPCRFPACGFGA